MFFYYYSSFLIQFLFRVTILVDRIGQIQRENFNIYIKNIDVIRFVPISIT